MDLERDEVLEALGVPVQACQERAAQPVPLCPLAFDCWSQLVFVPHDHDVTSLDSVCKEHCRGRFRCLPCFVC